MDSISNSIGRQPLRARSQIERSLVSQLVHDHVHGAIRETYTFKNAVILLVVLAGVSVHFTFQLVFEAASTDSAINSDVGITPTLETFGT
jgi:hypothetical protein